MKLEQDEVAIKQWRMETAADSATKYVRANVSEHLRQSGWDVDSNPSWLTDLPQDDLVVAASSLVGADKLGQLTDAAEAAGDTLMCAKLAALTGKLVFLRDGREPSIRWFAKAEDNLLKLSNTETTVELRDTLDGLELTVLMHVRCPNLYGCLQLVMCMTVSTCCCPCLDARSYFQG
jgi:hypothetical protein